MLTLTEFETRQPFAVRFLTQALQHQHLVNAYLFCGRDLATMYQLTLRLAQIINCLDKPEPAQACGRCTPCRWIADNAHPGVVTVSNATFLAGIDPETGAGRTKTGHAQKAIVVDQLTQLLQELSRHSQDFHRVVILCGAEESHVHDPLQVAEPPPRDWQAKDDGALRLLPLDRTLFPDPLANKFLKTLEEPPSDALFVLLTDSPEKLLETIVSRCQWVPFATGPTEKLEDLSSTVQEAFSSLLQQCRQSDYLATVQTFQQYASDQQLSAGEALEQFQQFLWLQLRHQVAQPGSFRSIRQMLTQVDTSRRMLRDKTREDAVLEDLFLSFQTARTSG